jgi:hypothetical protein
MDATSFELNVSVPADARYAGAMCDLAVHAARYAGCRGADADAYGEAVRAVVLACVASAGRAALMDVIVRRGNGPVEFLVACERRFGTVPARDRHVTIEWTDEGGRQMCRVARAMPEDI